MADEWSTGLNVGDVVNYVSNTGATIELKLSEREDSEPYEAVSYRGESDISCGTTSVRRYQVNNSDIALRIELRQSRDKDPSLAASESFFMSIRPELPAGEPVAPGYQFSFTLDEQSRQQYSNMFVLDNDTDTGPRARRSIENLTIGENTYANAVEVKYSDVTPVTSAVSDPNSLTGITRMIVAENGGLVQFELLNGDVYSRL